MRSLLQATRPRFVGNRVDERINRARMRLSSDAERRVSIGLVLLLE
jgi:hypothetical protein